MDTMRYLSGMVTAMIAVGLCSCAGTAPTAHVRDDVYDLPAQRAAMAPRAQAPTDGAEDFYDPGEAAKYNAAGRLGNYYDVTYNDPYYYNYGRFGFNAGLMGWQSGWSGPGWGMGHGWGAGFGNPWMGWGTGWGQPWGGMGWNDPWWWNRPLGWNTGMGMGWGMPCGWGNPWTYDPWCGGYGFGNYWGPLGNCWSCYVPISYGAPNAVVMHRPSVAHGGGSRPGAGTNNTRMAVRNPVGLMPAYAERIPDHGGGLKPGHPSFGSSTVPAARQRTVGRMPANSSRSDGSLRPAAPAWEPSRQGGFERGGSLGGGSLSSPGGGSRSPGSVRPR